MIGFFIYYLVLVTLQNKSQESYDEIINQGKGEKRHSQIHGS